MWNGEKKKDQIRCIPNEKRLNFKNKSNLSYVMYSNLTSVKIPNVFIGEAKDSKPNPELKLYFEISKSFLNGLLYGEEVFRKS